MHFGPRATEPGEGRGCTAGVICNNLRAGTEAGGDRLKPGHAVCSSSTGLGAEAGEGLEARILRDNRKNHAPMWPRDYILGRKGIIQVDCRERKKAQRGPSS